MTAPYRVDTITDSHGTYEERWMTPPPEEGVVFRVIAESWSYTNTDATGGRVEPHTVRIITDWQAVES